MLRFTAALIFTPYLTWLMRAFWSAPRYATVLAVASAATHTAIFFYVYVFPLALIALLIVWRFGRINLIISILIGGLCSAIYLLPYAADLGVDKIIPWLKYKIGTAVIMEIVFGSAVGALVWLLGVWRNPSMHRMSHDKLVNEVPDKQ